MTNWYCGCQKKKKMKCKNREHQTYYRVSAPPRGQTKTCTGHFFKNDWLKFEVVFSPAKLYEILVFFLMECLRTRGFISLFSMKKCTTSKLEPQIIQISLKEPFFKKITFTTYGRRPYPQRLTFLSEQLIVKAW